MSNAKPNKTQRRSYYDLEWPPELDPLLGKESDLALSKRFGINLSTIRGRRRRLGTEAAFPPAHGEPFRWTKAKARKSNRVWRSISRCLQGVKALRRRRDRLQRVEFAIEQRSDRRKNAVHAEQSRTAAVTGAAGTVTVSGRKKPVTALGPSTPW